MFTKDYKTGERLWSQLSSDYPDELDLKVNVSFVIERQGRLKEALELVNTILQRALDENYPRICGVLLGKARIQSKARSHIAWRPDSLNDSTVL